jgi:hypothetical protein
VRSPGLHQSPVDGHAVLVRDVELPAQLAHETDSQGQNLGLIFLPSCWLLLHIFSEDGATIFGLLLYAKSVLTPHGVRVAQAPGVDFLKVFFKVENRSQQIF